MDLLKVLQQDVTEHVNANPSIDWAKIKQVLTSIVATIDAISASLPAGAVKTALNVISSLIKTVISLLPS